MPVITGFDQLASVPEEQITDKIRRRVVSGTQGTMVHWRMKAGAQAAAHKHPHEQFVWMIKGTMDFRIGSEKGTMKPGDVAVIPGEVEHEAYFTEDSEVVDCVKTFFQVNSRRTCVRVNEIIECPLLAQSRHP